jgi:hypothetical protein
MTHLDIEVNLIGVDDGGVGRVRSPLRDGGPAIAFALQKFIAKFVGQRRHVLKMERKETFKEIRVCHLFFSASELHYRFCPKQQHCHVKIPSN